MVPKWPRLAWWTSGPENRWGDPRSPTRCVKTRRNVDRAQAHVAYMLWNRPQEARKCYWAVWRRNQYKVWSSSLPKECQDAEARKFWSKHFPVCASCPRKVACQDSSYCLYEDSTPCFSALCCCAWGVGTSPYHRHPGHGACHGAAQAGAVSAFRTGAARAWGTPRRGAQG